MNEADEPSTPEAGQADGDADIGDDGATGAPEPMRGWWVAPGMIAAAAIIVVGIVMFRGDDTSSDLGAPPASGVEPPSVLELIAAATAYSEASAAVSTPVPGNEPPAVEELIAAATAYAQASAAAGTPAASTPTPAD